MSGSPLSERDRGRPFLEVAIATGVDEIEEEKERGRVAPAGVTLEFGELGRDEKAALTAAARLLLMRTPLAFPCPPLPTPVNDIDLGIVEEILMGDEDLGRVATL